MDTVKELADVFDAAVDEAGDLGITLYEALYSYIAEGDVEYPYTSAEIVAKLLTMVGYYHTAGANVVDAVHRALSGDSLIVVWYQHPDGDTSAVAAHTDFRVVLLRARDACDAYGESWQALRSVLLAAKDDIQLSTSGKWTFGRFDVDRKVFV